MTQRIRALLKKALSNREMLSYLVFGGLTTLVSWATYFLLTAALQPDGYPEGSATRVLILNAAQIVSWVLSVLFAFVTNKRYVFRSRETRGGAVREFFLFLSARGLSYLLFDLLLYNFCVFGLGIDHKWTKLMMNVLVVVFNYFASKFIIFRKPDREGSDGV